MFNSQDFKTLDDLDKAYADHVDSLLVGGFIEKGTHEYADLMGAWSEAVNDYIENQKKDYRRLPDY